MTNAKNISSKAFFLIAFMAWVYIILKAWYQPLIFDEATTFFYFLPPGEGHPWIGDAVHSNNHLFLTYILKAITEVSTHALALRLPSVLAFIPFVIAIFKLSKGLNPWIKVLALLVCAHPFYLEFFALARGYAPFMALFLWTLVFLKQFFQAPTLKNAYIVLSIGFISCGFFLGGLPYVAAMGLVMVAMLPSLKHKIILAISSLPFLLWVYWGLQLKEANQLYFGGTDLTATWHSINTHFARNGEFLLIVFWVIIALSVLWAFKKIKAIDRFVLIFLIALLLISFQHIFLDTPLPAQRTAIPALLLGSIILLRAHSYLKWGLIAGAALTTLNLGSIDLHYAHVENWKAQQVPSEFNEIINASEHASVGGYRYANLSFMYNQVGRNESPSLYSINDRVERNWLLIEKGSPAPLNYRLEKGSDWLDLYRWDTPKPRHVMLGKSDLKQGEFTLHINCNDYTYSTYVKPILWFKKLSIAVPEGSDCTVESL